MYCIPYPRGSDITPPRVSYVASCRYSPSGLYSFDGFYECALDVEHLHCLSTLFGTRRPTAFSRDPLASAIQAWLFFGLASEALGREIAHDEFVEKGTGGSDGTIDLRIASWFWLEVKERWDKLHSTLPEAVDESKKAHLKPCSEKALTTLVHFDLLEGEAFNEDTRLVLLSVHMLLHVLSNIIGCTVLRTT